MSGYLFNIALRGAGSYSMNSIRPRKGIFESGNVTNPLIHSIQNERTAGDSDKFHYQTERTEPINREIPPPEMDAECSTTSTTPPDGFAPDSLSDPVVEDITVPKVTFGEKTSSSTHPEIQTIETEPRRDVDHTFRPDRNPGLNVRSVKATLSSPQIYEERQLGTHALQQAEGDKKTQKNDIEKGASSDGSAILEPRPVNDISEGSKQYTSIKYSSSADTPANYHKQSYVEKQQEIIKPESPSKIEQTRISPRRQAPFSKMGFVRKKTAIQPEAQQTVKVKIGKVEVRAAQASTPPLPPPSQAPVRSGFADYLSVRNYGFPEY